MSTNDFIKFLTQQLVMFFDQPRDLRRDRRLEKKQAKKSLSYNWFGIIPLSISMLFRRSRQ